MSQHQHSPGRGDWPVVILAEVLLIAPMIALALGVSGWAGWGSIVAGLIGIALVVWSLWAAGRDGHLVRGSIDRLLGQGASADAWSMARLVEVLEAGVQEERLRHKAAEDAARPLAIVFNAVDEPVVATDSRSRVILCNAAAAAYVGAPAGRLVGRPIDEVFTQGEFLRLHRQATAGLPSRDRLRIARPEGERTLEVACVPMRGDGAVVTAGPGAANAVVMTIRDVTDLSRTVQMKTDFVANASHELRTPIATIKASLETLEAGAKDDPQMRERIFDALMHQTVRLEEMARDLLDLSRLESADGHVPRREVSVREVADLMAQMFQKVCQERDLVLRFDLDPALEQGEPPRSNRSLLELILQNLIDNATKFAFEGTTVRVAVNAMESRGHAAGPIAPPGLQIQVSDRGMGIPLADQSRIFERYYQVDEARTSLGQRRGSGLGLAIVKHAVRSLGGTIRVQSVWKQGTTMVVELPPENGIATNGAVASEAPPPR